MGEIVTDSVQQILRSCDSMIKETNGVEYVDIWSLARTLQTQANELSEVFDKTPGDEKTLAAKKQVVEATALRLEFFMAIRLGIYEDRYKLRKYAKKIYEDTRNVALMVAKDESATGVLIDEWGARTRWALKFYARSLHVLFEVDKEDEKKIKEILDAMNAMKGDKLHA